MDRILVRDGRATGVVLESDEEIPARVVASNADLKNTFLRLVGPESLDPEFVRAVDRIKMEGVSMKVFCLRPVAGWAGHRTPIRCLYLCGSGAHPGGGVTGAPGRNAAKQILSDWCRGRIR